ncbi:DUF3426 domain-containing protein [Alkalimarinus coralli]|uniref:DUF3426 domain-containing protein n=1 Tax=Alkalimarinus coralli TaxID=2935863 RepID=UPI00202B5EAF|nr:DUF3426 domain-containing protein [Alkalimarinus coralli]
MSTTHLTQCPHCQATFKVQDQHLNAAGGKVRCGSCLEVFNALENLVDSTAAKPKPATPPHKTNGTDQAGASNKPNATETPATEAVSDKNEPDEDELIFADNPDEDSEDDGYTGPGTFSSELSDSFLELESGGGNHFSDEELEDSLDKGVTSKKAGSDESWAEQMLEEIETSKPSTPATQKSKPTEHTGNTPASNMLSAEFSALDEDITEKLDQEERSNNIHHKSTSSDSPDAALTSAHASQREAHYNLSHQYQNLQVDPLELPRSSERSLLGTLVWTVLNLSLLVILLAQLAWFHYDKLSQFDQLRPFYEQGCQLVGCQLPDLVDTSKIKSQNLIVRSHPTARKALIIDAVIVNQALFDQPFPNLALYFSDLNNKVIAQRLFEPSEYLAGDVKSWAAMPKGTPIHISIEIMDPGKDAVNYSVKFFKHTPQI